MIGIAGGFDTVVAAGLVQDGPHAYGGDTNADDQVFGDLPFGAASRIQAQDFYFSSGEAAWVRYSLFGHSHIYGTIDTAISSCWSMTV
tara:strand:- start:164 stop:427 length:264 start_codon:yes stop_codon:yes gene_type:complete